MSVIGTLWRCRWNAARLAAACFLLWVFGVDASARAGRVMMRALPAFDHAAEVRSLRLEGRFGEAVLVADGALASPSLEEAARREVEAERSAAIAERDSWLRRAKDAGLGALTGRGETLERLVGAVASDFFLVGDLRDLVIQGGRQLLDGESDEVIVLLSVAGVVTTLAPEIDWVPSVLKAARRGRSLSEPLAAWLRDAIRAGRRDDLAKAFGDVRRLAGAGSPGAAARLLRHADSPDDLAMLARFAESHGPRGLGALHVGGAEAASLLRTARALPAYGAAHLERAVIRAADKGPAGVRLLASPAGRALRRPHPLVGLLKGVYKGNAEALATRLLDRYDPAAWWIVPLTASWALVEGAWLVARCRGAARRPPVTAAARPAGGSARGTSRRAPSACSTGPQPARR